MVFDVNAVALADACENVASHPNLVSRRSRAFAKDLKFPLTFRDLGIDPLVVDASVETDVEVLLDDLASDVTDIAKANSCVVAALWCRVAMLWKA